MPHDPQRWAVAPPTDRRGPALRALAAAVPARTVLLRVAGGRDHSLVHGDWRPGAIGHADATLSLSQQTLDALLAGETDLEQAFQTGAVRCTDLRLLAGLARALASRTDAADRRALRPLPGRAHLVDADEVAAYANVIGDDSSLWFGPGAIAPPMFHTRLVRDLLFDIMQAPDTAGDLARVLHAGHELVLHRSLRVGEVVHSRGEVLSVEEKQGGRLSTCRLCLVAGGEVVQEARTTFFLRADTGPLPAPLPTPRPDAAMVVDEVLAGDLADRYAQASGDDNPLHADADFARAAGFDGPLVHGLCTLAVAERALRAALERQRFAAGDPRRVRGLSVRFTAPVRPGDTLSVLASPTADGMAFDAFVGDVQVLSHGRLLLAEDHH